MKVGVRADAQGREDRRGQVRRSVGLAGGHSRMSISPTDDLTRLDAAAGQEAGEHVAPVVTTRSELLARGVLAVGSNRRDLRCAAHLATHYDQGLVEQPTVLEIVEEAAEAVVDRGEQFALEVAEGVLVSVPASQIDLHHPHTCLDQSTSNQEPLAPLFTAVLVADLLRFLGQVKRVVSPAAGGQQQPQSLLPPGVPRGQPSLTRTTLAAPSQRFESGQ